jgi:hypothetical protein
LDVGGWFGHEHKGFVKAEEEAFIRFYGAFYAVHVVVTGVRSLSEWWFVEEEMGDVILTLRNLLMG